MRNFLFLLALIGAAAVSEARVAADFSEAVAGLERRDGLIETYVDHDKARVLLALKPDSDGAFGRYIYVAYLTGGLGSNPVGLDRSRPSDTYILAFRRAGDRIVALIENHSFRASADNPAEKKAVETSFAQSAIWSTPIAETAEDGTLLIDFTDFLTRDSMGVVSRLKDRGQGAFKREADLSFADTAAVNTFPRNLEFDAHVTFSSASPGPEVNATTPVPERVTLMLHTSLMALPEDGYQPRVSDPRAGLISTAHVDMSAPLGGNTVVDLARRFRLEKDASGTVINPIIFYIDNGAPEPIRGALLDGARWWADAFEAAGFPGGYRAEILPEGVHPLDARYNMVNWVHRATRGWSYGASVYDPRTGEILRGVVLLGSLRVRQDIKIFEALAGAAGTGTGAPDDPIELALARIRQLSAHEIGHSLGFAHNMAASSYGRESVMDYPAPDVRFTADGLDFGAAYDVGIGEWDIWATKFLYGDYDDTNPRARAALFAEADAGGLVYVSDGDSRSPGSGHIRGSLWDNGADAIDELANVMAVRADALARFGAGNLRPGEQFSALQTKFVPLYLYHRYQLQAAAKFIGGYDFAYRAQGDGRAAPVSVAWAEQLRGLDAVLGTLAPDALMLPAETVALLSPRGQGGADPQFAREVFAGSASPAFSYEQAVGAAADLSLGALLHPRRLQRLAEQATMVDGHEGLSGVLTRTWQALLRANRRESRAELAVRGIVLSRLGEHMIEALQAPATGALVRAEMRIALEDLQRAAERTRGAMEPHTQLLVRRIDDALARARTPAVKTPAGPRVPPGSPIGSDAAESCWHC